MPDIHITREHTLGIAQARVIVERLGESLQQKFGLVPRWDGDTLHFARSGVDGHIEVAPDQVRVTAHLGALLTALKPTVEAEIQRKLDEYFPQAPR